MLSSSTKLDITTDDDDLELLLTNKQAKLTKETKKLYEGVHCSESLFIFAKLNPFRKFLY